MQALSNYLFIIFGTASPHPSLLPHDLHLTSSLFPSGKLFKIQKNLSNKLTFLPKMFIIWYSRLTKLVDTQPKLRFGHI